MRHRSTLFACATLLAGLAHDALAGSWQMEASVGNDVILVGVSAPTDQDVFVGGTVIDMSSMIPRFSCRVAASHDGGATFARIDSAFASITFCAVGAIHFADPMHGWVAVGSDVYRTSDGGSSWASASVGSDVGALHFTSTSQGFALGDGGVIAHTSDGGATWSSVPSGTDADLSHTFWLDAQRGWVAGTRVRVETDPETGAETEWPDALVVLATDDGGATWSMRSEIPSLGAGPVFFLGDARTGWVAAFERQNEERTVAHLLRTADGGASFADLSVPVEVGTLNMMMSMPIQTSLFAAMHWSNDSHGHLGGGAYLAKLSSSGGGGSGDKQIWRVVDFLTEDGGTTWQKTELGTVTIPLTGGDVPSDGAIIAGELRGLMDGFMVGEGGRVWRYEHVCVADAECGSGYRCAAGVCEAVGGGGPCTPACPGGTLCWDGACVPLPDDDTTPTDAWAGDTTNGGQDARPDGAGPGGNASGGNGGCGCGVREPAPCATAAWWWALTLVALPVARRFRAFRGRSLV